MIHVKRNTPPEGLADKDKEWRKILENDPAVDVKSAWDNYNKDKLRNSLMDMYSKKCCYCEGPLPSTVYPEVEHFRPKSVQKFKELCFFYKNLHIVCPRCNRKKGTEFDEKLICPSIDHPEEHISFPVDFEVVEKSERGKISKELLELNNDELKACRREYLKEILSQMIVIEEHMEKGNLEGVKALYTNVKRLFEPDKPFSLMINDTLGEHFKAVEIFLEDKSSE